jgi:hypothetical protein
VLYGLDQHGRVRSPVRYLLRVANDSPVTQGVRAPMIRIPRPPAQGYRPPKTVSVRVAADRHGYRAREQRPDALSQLLAQSGSNTS